jgi:hypothetical protein
MGQVSDEITSATRQAASQSMKGVAVLLERSREHGRMRKVPLPFVVALADALTEATIDSVIRDPGNADAYGRDGFGALWRMIA